ncbi:MAG: hypothetical protein KKH98_04765, partial [Spirochaetes bacterium]|nr:hypothetical protein [Spirochaetota bacterium]
VYLFYIEEEKGDYYLKYLKSVNNGATWSDPETILASEDTKTAIFFPSVFLFKGRFFIIYQGRENIKKADISIDKLFMAEVDQKTGKIIDQKKLLDKKKGLKYTPIINRDNKGLVWSEFEENIWNVYIGFVKEGEEITPLKVNLEKKNCYNHTTLFFSESIKIFWSMLDKKYSQICSREYYLDSGDLGEKEVVVKTKGNSYLSGAVLFQDAQYIAWQEEYDKNKSAIFIKREDTTSDPPVITSTIQNTWYNSADIIIRWKAPLDVSGSGGFGYYINKENSPEKVIQNLPPEADSLSLKNLLTEGTNYLNLKFYDKAGNESDAATVIIKLDRTKPFITGISSPTHPKDVFVTNRTAVVKVDAQDDYQEIVGFSYVIDHGKDRVNKDIINIKTNLFSLKLDSGISYLRISAVDSISNKSRVASYPFYVSDTRAGPVSLVSGRTEEKLITRVETITQMITEEETNIAVEGSSDVEAVLPYLIKNYSILSIPVYKSKTADLIGKPENLTVEEIEIEGVKLKKMKFDLYVAAKDDESLPPKRLYVWSPILNYTSLRSKWPYVPFYIIKKSRLFQGKAKKYRYFKVEVLTLPEDDFIILSTVKDKLMSSAVTKQKKRINTKLIPGSLRWLLYE